MDSYSGRLSRRGFPSVRRVGLLPSGLIVQTLKPWPLWRSLTSTILPLYLPLMEADCAAVTTPSETLVFGTLLVANSSKTKEQQTTVKATRLRAWFGLLE